MDVKRAVELYAQGWSLRQIAAELDLTETTVSDQLRRGVTMRRGVRAAVTDHLGRTPTRAELTAARRAAHGLARMGRASVLQVPGSDANSGAGDRNYLVLAKPRVCDGALRWRFRHRRATSTWECIGSPAAPTASVLSNGVCLSC
jgi:hypothetical protein